MTQLATAIFSFALLLLSLAPATLVAQDCVGDCSNDGRVSVSELVSCVRIALGGADFATCMECDSNGDGRVSIADLVTAVSHALCDCAACPTPRPTNTPLPTSTPTNTLPPPNTPTNTIAPPTSTPPVSPTPMGCACDFNGFWSGTATSTLDTCDPGLGSEGFSITIAHQCNGAITEPPNFVGTTEQIDGQCCLVFSFEVLEDDGGKSCNTGRVCQGTGGTTFDGTINWTFFENPNASCDSTPDCQGAESLNAFR